MENKHGGLFVYTHFNHKIVSVVSLTCQTDFAEKTELFKKIGHELAIQAATSEAENVAEFLKEENVFGDGPVSLMIEELQKELKEKIELVNIQKILF